MGFEQRNNSSPIHKCNLIFISLALALSNQIKGSQISLSPNMNFMDSPLKVKNIFQKRMSSVNRTIPVLNLNKFTNDENQSSYRIIPVRNFDRKTENEMRKISLKNNQKVHRKSRNHTKPNNL